MLIKQDLSTGVLFKIYDKQPCPFNIGFPQGGKILPRNPMSPEEKCCFFLLSFLPCYNTFIDQAYSVNLQLIMVHPLLTCICLSMEFSQSHFGL